MAVTEANLTVEGMSCQHCVNSITKGVGGMNGVQKVNVNLQDKKVTVAYDAEVVSLPEIIGEIEEQGYEVKDK